MRGLGKFVGKTALYGLGGVIQPFYGIYAGVSRGNFNAVLITISRDGWMIRTRRWIMV